MKQKCLACGVEKDPAIYEISLHPDPDGVADPTPIPPLTSLDCSGPGKDWRVVKVCHACLHKLDPDMWISDRCWAPLDPITPFEQLPQIKWRHRVLQSFDQVHLPEIQRGVICLHTEWINQGVAQFHAAIKEFITRDLDVIYLDANGLTPGSATAFFGPAGFGPGHSVEAIWIRDGRIVARVSTATASWSLIKEHTERLFDCSRR